MNEAPGIRRGLRRVSRAAQIPRRRLSGPGLAARRVGAAARRYTAADVTPPQPAQDGDVLIALSLLAVGIAGTLIEPETVRDLITGLSLPRGIERDILALISERTVAYACLLASPVLLVLGSLLPGI